ncbi:MAG TPA: aldo/keto reductase [Patescibacteria group bacterium]|nr:aldo/keto reductase [Patescibacteria group bacterium]
MENRKLGTSELSVAPLCFGGNVFGWTADEAMSFEILDAFVHEGFNFVDTADVYTKWIEGNKGGESETIIGNWFASSGKRREIVLATKCGMDMGQDGKGLSKAHILKSVDGSLKRLKTDYIDLYQAHADDETVPQEETLGAYDALIKAGKVRAIGASNFNAVRLESAIQVARRNGLPVYASLQPEYNLYDRAKFEAELAKVCRAHGIGVISYYSLARGFLSGKYRSEADLGKSPRGVSVQKNYFNARGWRILRALDDIANSAGATPAQVALAWLIGRDTITAPIASASSVAQLLEITRAVNVKLDETARAMLDAASAEETPLP